MHGSIKTAYTGLWASLLAIALYACTGSSFTGSGDTKAGGERSRRLTGDPGKGTGGSGDANDGDDGDGTTSTGNTGDGSPSQGTGDDTAGDDGTDGPGGDDLDGGDDGVTTSLLIPMDISQLVENSRDADEEITVFVQRINSDGSLGPVQSFHAGEHEAKSAQLPNICHKKRATRIKTWVEIDGETITPPSKYVGRTGGTASVAEITWDDGSSTIGTLVDRGRDNTIRYACPAYDLTVEGVN